MNPVRIALLVLLAILLAACGGKSGTTKDDGAPDDDLFSSSDGTGTSGLGGDSLGQGSRFGDAAPGSADDLFSPEAPLKNRVVYFAFDEVEIEPQYRELLTKHGRHLADNPTLRVRLEGHADERGSREYNVGLGERRAQTVRQFLLLQGATAMQITTVSYGEERPAVLGSDEEAWALNRRVELVYIQ